MLQENFAIPRRTTVLDGDNTASFLDDLGDSLIALIASQNQGFCVQIVLLSSSGLLRINVATPFCLEIQTLLFYICASYSTL
jgi:hypothetical protein